MKLDFDNCSNRPLLKKILVVLKEIRDILRKKPKVVMTPSNINVLVK